MNKFNSNLAIVSLTVLLLLAATGWLYHQCANHHLKVEVATFKAENSTLQEEVNKKAAAPQSLEYRLACYELVSGDAVCDVYAGSERGFCHWEEACRGRSLDPDRRGNDEDCVGYFVCSKDPNRINLPVGPEVGEPSRPASESDLSSMGK